MQAGPGCTVQARLYCAGQAVLCRPGCTVQARPGCTVQARLYCAGQAVLCRPGCTVQARLYWAG